MSETAFDCSECDHPIRRHTIKKWPQISKLCVGCDCPGYQPNYRKGDQ